MGGGVLLTRECRRFFLEGEKYSTLKEKRCLAEEISLYLIRVCQGEDTKLPGGGTLERKKGTPVESSKRGVPFQSEIRRREGRRKTRRRKKKRHPALRDHQCIKGKLLSGWIEEAVKKKRGSNYLFKGEEELKIICGKKKRFQSRGKRKTLVHIGGWQISGGKTLEENL